MVKNSSLPDKRVSKIKINSNMQANIFKQSGWWVVGEAKRNQWKEQKKKNIYFFFFLLPLKGKYLSSA